VSRDSSKNTLREQALEAFARRAPDCAALLTAALEDAPHDGALLLAEAAALAEGGVATPFTRLEAILEQAPDWAAGHRGLAQLKIEFGTEQPLASIEAALQARPDDPSVWHTYLNLLAGLGLHEEAADKTAGLRRRIGEVPALLLLEARYAGLAGDPGRGRKLLQGLPEDLPDLAYQRARNALQRGAIEEAESVLEAVPRDADMRLWAMRELCWRAQGNDRHEWLLHDGNLVGAFDLALSSDELTNLCNTLRALHQTKLAPPSQSLRGGTQTRGALHLREEPVLADLFARFAAALADYPARVADLSEDHPLAPLAGRTPRIAASWSVRLTKGGFHVPHLHDSGLLSSACHLVVPESAKTGEGVLELGRPPADMALDEEPIASFTPQPGRLILFPSFLYHSTTPFCAGERLSAVIDAR